MPYRSLFLQTGVCAACFAIGCAASDETAPRHHGGDGGSGGEPAVAPPDPVCSEQGWCWLNPQPEGYDRAAIWGTNAADIWTVGAHGAVSRFDGSYWRPYPTGLDVALMGVSGSSTADVFIVGDGGVILHWDGKGFTQMDTGTSAPLSAVWSDGPLDAWAVALDGTTIHYDGSAWTAVPSGVDQALTAVWGSGPDDVWAVGDLDTSGFPIMIHYDGSAWSPAGGPLYAGRLYAVWGTAANDVYAAGADATLIHFDGTEWSSAELPGVLDFKALSGSGPHDVWAVGVDESDPDSMGSYRAGVVHFDGTAWTRVSPPSLGLDPSALAGVWAGGENGVWTAGLDGFVLRYADGAWTNTTSPLLRGVFDIWAAADDDIWIADLSGVVHYDGKTFTDAGIGIGYYSIAGTAANDVWATGASGTFRFDGSTWSQTSAIGGYRVRTPAPNTAWLLGASDVALYAGGSWKSWDANQLQVLNLYDLVAFSATDAWLSGDDSDGVGSCSRLLHYDGNTWNEVPNTLEPVSQDLNSGKLCSEQMIGALWAAGDNDVWGLSQSPYDAGMQIVHFNGSWHVAKKTGDALFGIWGNGASDVWASARDGALLHWDGSAWTSATSGLSAQMYYATTNGSTSYALGPGASLFIHH